MPTLPVRSRFVHFHEVGQGEPVLLLHASSSSGAQWRSLQTELAGRFRTLAVDLLGYGRTSAWDAGEELSNEDELALAEAVVAGAAGGPIHLVGHSYGGLTALRLALSGRVRIRTLTLVEPIAFWLLRAAGDLDLYGEIRAVADAYVAAHRRGDVEGAVAPYIDYWNGPGAWHALPEHLRASIRATAGKTAREWATAFEVDLPPSALGAIVAPTLVIQGAATKRTTKRICELVQAAIPGARRVEIAGAGHMCPLTHPEAVNRAVARHLGAARFENPAVAA